ncbi:hypothetical protein LACR_1684 [Lactococcus cremoris subsp. cremoris SK11]|uniref:Uncharacterized protein n=1 Tax=Lactococcus lactis subsp. cremoris (strain SK11) TaxID=272622 RepID=Q02XZ2_LACLS|nr:hypothetical protein LACR_1684 [Lactococcus cremoris subsp. cremoris SK11]
MLPAIVVPSPIFVVTLRANPLDEMIERFDA